MNDLSCGLISVPTQDFSLWAYAAFYYSSSARISKAKGKAGPQYMVEVNGHKPELWKR